MFFDDTQNDEIIRSESLETYVSGEEVLIKEHVREYATSRDLCPTSKWIDVPPFHTTGRPSMNPDTDFVLSSTIGGSYAMFNFHHDIEFICDCTKLHYRFTSDYYWHDKLDFHDFKTGFAAHDTLPGDIAALLEGVLHLGNDVLLGRAYWFMVHNNKSGGGLFVY